MCDNETHSLPDLFNQHNCLRTLLIIAVVFRQRLMCVFEENKCVA